MIKVVYIKCQFGYDFLVCYFNIIGYSEIQMVKNLFVFRFVDFVVFFSLNFKIWRILIYCLLLCLQGIKGYVDVKEYCNGV